MVVEEVADPKKRSAWRGEEKKSGLRRSGRDSGSEANGRAGTHCGADGEQVDSQKCVKPERDTIFNEYHTRVASW